jgi:hypothetical protein
MIFKCALFQHQLNVASLWRKSSSSGGFGAVIKNSLGLVVAAICEVCHGQRDAIQLNALALQKSLWLAKVLGLSGVTVEGECRDLLAFLNSNGPCLAPAGTLVDDIRQISSFFSVISFNIIPHSSYLVGSALTRGAFTFTGCKFWIVECPDFLLSAAHTDLLKI